MSVTSERTSNPIPRTEAPSASVTERAYGWADAIAFVAVLNLLVIVFTLAGGVVLGIAPAFSAAATACRSRLRGEARGLVRTFATAWRQNFWSATALQAPGWLVLAILAVNLLAFRGRAGLPLWIALIAATAIAAIYHVLLVVMDAHYELARRDCRRLAGLFLLRFPASWLLLAATTVLVGALTAWVPGLLPTVSIGAWLYLCTALCLSFFAANDHHTPTDSPRNLNERNLA